MFNRVPFKGSLTCAVLAIGVAFLAVSKIELLPAFPADVFNGHQVILDNQNKIIPWSVPVEKAYDHFLRLRWDFIKSKVPACPARLRDPPTRSTTSIAHSGISTGSWNRILG